MQFKNVPPSQGFDRDLLRRVKSFLYQKGHLPLQALDITINRGVVLVRGQVPTFYVRQVAIECVKHVPGVIQVIDAIDVVRDPSQHPTGGDPVEEKSRESTIQRRRDMPDQKPSSPEVRGKLKIPRVFPPSGKERKS